MKKHLSYQYTNVMDSNLCLTYGILKNRKLYCRCFQFSCDCSHGKH